VQALDDIFDLQATLCGSGNNKRIADIAASLRARLARPDATSKCQWCLANGMWDLYYQ